MKNLIRSTVGSLLLIGTSISYGEIPAMNVTVSDAGGKAAFKGMTDSTGSFATTKLNPGHYIVQVNSQAAGMKGNHYTIVVAAGSKKVSATAIPGEKLNGHGVALKVDVAAGMNVTGQVANESERLSKNGKKMVWIAPQLGSNMSGKWVEEGSPEAVAAKNAGNFSTQSISDFQQRH